jgi:hypothetical protein
MLPVHQRQLPNTGDEDLLQRLKIKFRVEGRRLRPPRKVMPGKRQRWAWSSRRKVHREDAFRLKLLERQLVQTNV